MHGLGNDFVVFDARSDAFVLSNDDARRIADRRRGIGCDQILVLEPSETADVFMRIYNADGTEANACGDGARCIAKALFAELGRDEATIETVDRVLECRNRDVGASTNMGAPSLEWQQIPLAEARDTLHLDLEFGALKDPVALSVGNPHLVFFVDDVDTCGIETLGPMIETYFLFPERINVGAAQIIDDANLRLRVWERGAGLTEACGTGACAAVVAAASRGLTSRDCSVHLPGGDIHVCWQENGDIVMSGDAAHSFDGVVDLAELSDADRKS